MLAQIAGILVVIGSLNWGFIGLGMLVGGTGWNVVNMIFGTVPVLEAVIYVLVGLSAVWMMWRRR